MLLDKVFDSVKHIKRAWVRHKGRLHKVDRQVEPQRHQPQPANSMFPIKKPRYEDPNA